VRVLCCLDGTNAEQIAMALNMFTAVQPLAVGMLHVTDTRPRVDMDLIRERFWRHPLHPHHPAPAPPAHPHHPPTPPEHLPRPSPREEEMDEAEKASAEEILKEGCGYCAGAETMEREGRPEQEIVNLAAQWRADLVIVCSRAAYRMKEEVGPRSVGHVARFVIDHAPCPVLLLRPMTRQRVPFER
jgi:nucleotide-binding universal stress UspA family protein